MRFLYYACLQQLLLPLLLLFYSFLNAVCNICILISALFILRVFTTVVVAFAVVLLSFLDAMCYIVYCDVVCV